MTRDEFAKLSADEKFDYLHSYCEAARDATSKLAAALQALRQQVAKIEAKLRGNGVQLP